MKPCKIVNGETCSYLYQDQSSTAQFQINQQNENPPIYDKVKYLEDRLSLNLVLISPATLYVAMVTVALCESNLR